jgi:hypothetical protein
MTMPNRIRNQPTIAFLFVATLLATPGCSWTNWMKRPQDDPIARVLPPDATLDEITHHLNTERGRLMGWRSSDVRISASGKGILVPKLDANLSVESPRNLRLVATSIRGKEVDFGSNSERFWFWTKAERPDIILTATHDGQQNLIELPFPPSWLMEALGVVPLDTSRSQLLREAADLDEVQLVSNQLLDGRPVQRVMTVNLALGQIVQHALFDQQSQLIASARMSDFRRPNGEDASTRLPHRVELNWVRAKMKLTLTMKEIDVNPQFNSHTWELLQDPNCRIVDLDLVEPPR